MMKLRSFAVVTGIAMSGIVTSGAFAPAQAIGTLLTSDVGYTGPGLDLSPYANGLNNFTSGPAPIPGGITFTSTRQSVLGKIEDYGLVGFNGYPGNGRLDSDSVYAGLYSGTGYMTFSFENPVQSFGAFLNYGPKGGAPGVPSELWDNPTISTYNGSTLLSSFDLSTAPGGAISTPGNPPGGGSDVFIEGGVNEFRFRGIDEGSAVITSFRIGGSNIVATGNARGYYLSTSVPEPFTVIGTLVGGSVALRMRKKLKSSTK
jgi:hypothetical protein